MYFLDKRVNVICEELKKLKVKQKFDIEKWEYKEGNYFHPADAEADSAPWETFDCRNMHWYGKDRHYWFKTVYRVPEELDGKRMWLHVGAQIDEWDDAKNPQFLLFVNGEAVQGIDMNHRDTLPGSAIHEVYEVTKEEYAQIAAKLTQMSDARRLTLAGTGEAVTVFNPIGRVRNDIVELGDFAGNAITDGEGNIYPVQKTKDGSVAFVKDLPSKGYQSFFAFDAKETEESFTLHGDRQLETPFYSVTFDEGGMFTSLYDKEHDREVIQPGKQANLLRMYEDKPIYFDNWDIDIYYTEKYWDVDQAERMEWTEMGPVRAVLEIDRKASNSTFTQKIIFYAKSRRIDFVTHVDWKEHQTLLKVHFPVAVHTDEATFDIQFGSLTRKTHQNTSWDVARFESCGQKWMDLSEGHYGVSLLNDCKYGHSVKDSNMALTLIKSGTEPNPVADQEEHQFTYAIYPHGEGWRAAGTVDEAYRLNQPLTALTGTRSGEKFSYADVSHDNVVIETIKQAEAGDGVVIRMYESENSYTKAKLTVNAAFEKAYICNLLEEAESDAPVSGNCIDVVLKPYEVVTVLLK